MPFYAHKDTKRFYTLSGHLASVAAGAASRAAALPRGGGELLGSALLAGFAHDFGKYTGFFQKYLKTGRGGAEKQHAFLSALWAVHLAEFFATGISSELKLALFLAVVRHHRHLSGPGDYLAARRDLEGDWNELAGPVRERLVAVSSQISDLKGRAGPVAVSLKCAARRTARLIEKEGISPPDWLFCNWSLVLEKFFFSWQDILARLYTLWRRFRKDLEEKVLGKGAGYRDLEHYFDLLLMFSSLIDADKLHAARIKDDVRPEVPGDAVEAYRAAKFERPRAALDVLRQDLYRSVLERIAMSSPTQKIFTITAPTGTGKTLAGLAAAFWLRQRLAEERGVPPRIIYALPFTSITDQVFSLGKDIFRQALGTGGEVPSPYILKHHHLADLSYVLPGGSEDIPADEALMLTESWQSELVITTFVQFFGTLVGYENRMLKKFNRMGGAVAVLDEVQNIPVEYWPLVEEVLRAACRYLNMRIILMTATRPEWFSGDEVWELAGGEEEVRRRFAALDRVKIEADTAAITVEEMLELFLKEYRKENSYLVVLNTIKSSISFYNLLRDALKAYGTPLYYLSTNIVPAAREKRLAEIGKSLREGKKFIAVSTQVVEAGVDLDFDVVWRDIGPVDAVVQVAGRCNRHFARPRGRVRLVHLTGGRAEVRTLASYVYGKIHTLNALSFFEKHSELPEPAFYDAVADYFNAVRRGKSDAAAREILNAMALLRFGREDCRGEELSVSEFSLIQEKPNYTDVFVCVNEHAAGVWEKYQSEVAQEKDLRRRREAFLEIKRDFRRYLVSVPVKYLAHKIPHGSSPLVIPQYLLSEIYDNETGFMRIEDEGALFF